MELSINTRQAYSEIDEFLELLDEKHRNKIPKKLREFFKSEKDNGYIKNLSFEIPIKEQNLKEETLSILALLNLNYWCENEEIKQELLKIYNENEEKYQIELKNKYDLDNIFKNKRKEIVVEETSLPVEIKKETVFKKVINFIKGLFNKTN